MVTANQKYTIDEKQKSNPNTLQIILKSQEKRTKEGGKKKDLENKSKTTDWQEEHPYQ